MSQFHEGPANGQRLLLGRAPRFLRVVVAPNDKVDALDQVDDTPTDSETIHVYERQTEPVKAHINAGRGKSGWYQLADYAYLPQQPEDHEMRTIDAWHQWIRQTCERLDGE